MSDPVVLSASEVSVSFRQRQGLFRPPQMIPAVRDVSFEVAQGEVFGIVGESGSGKSTMAKMILRLLRPDAGRLTLAGQPMATIAPYRFARLVQPVFQDPYSSLNPRRSLREIIEMPAAVAGDLAPAERQDRARELFTRVGLPMRLFEAYPNQISGGQRQRVAIARALMTRPRVLICDEPTSALDVSVQAQILDLFEELRAQFALTYVFISHNLAVVERIADRVGVMYRGQMVEQGPAQQIFGAPSHPYTRMLLASALPPQPGRPLPVINRDFDSAPAQP
ncbi:ATP-binding cassette domain-containing protein [Pseudooceanicola marinus]|uniref:ATP-binding cassette domain-containing protein n=1 Tax=Pseudooceanicola marinus TaxID=396013 RepID=UPI001CD73CD1|nr:ATP-binding cassette domain-containing protein [Pseudooceanicola marinus]MCA1337483.1 ATP-binding cassette domain-containing protein [Pseudooceanicola marinus]